MSEFEFIPEGKIVFRGGNITFYSALQFQHSPFGNHDWRFRRWTAFWLGYMIGPLIMAVRPYKTLHFGYWSEATGWKWIHAEREKP